MSHVRLKARQHRANRSRTARSTPAPIVGNGAAAKLGHRSHRGQISVPVRRQAKQVHRHLLFAALERQLLVEISRRVEQWRQGGGGGRRVGRTGVRVLAIREDGAVALGPGRRQGRLHEGDPPSTGGDDLEGDLEGGAQGRLLVGNSRVARRIRRVKGKGGQDLGEKVLNRLPAALDVDEDGVSVGDEGVCVQKGVKEKLPKTDLLLPSISGIT